MTGSKNNSLKQKKPLIIIDGYGFIFRAYHVQPPLTSPSGRPVGAIYGFTSMLIKLISDFKPDHAVVVLDHKDKNFRHNLYKDYKANRPPASEDLIYQLALVETAAKALNFICLSKSGYEADDIIASLAGKACETKREAIIISADKDLMQLVNEHIKMFDPTKSKFISNEDIINKFGVEAGKVREVQALTGDKSDNIPGVAGIGPKTASMLINEYGSVNGVYSALDKLSPRHRQLLLSNKDNALLSWQLVGLDNNIPIEENISDFPWTPPFSDHISEFLNINGFKSLNKRIEALFQIKIDSPAGNISTVPRDTIEYINVTDANGLDPLISSINKSGVVAVSATAEDNRQIISLSEGKNIYTITLKIDRDKEYDLFSYSGVQSVKSDSAEIENILGSILTNSAIKKIIFDAKSLMKIFKYDISGFDDLMLMDYLLNSATKARSLKDIIESTGSEKDYKESELIAGYIDCYCFLERELLKNRMLHLYKSVDLPMVRILHAMEKAGVKIDTFHLQSLSDELQKKADYLEDKIFKIVGKEFNIGSPKQLGTILFDELKLPFGKLSGKSKSYSTNASTLEQISMEGYELADFILEYRHLTKLKSTYTDALPKQINHRTGRIHTTFLQCTTTTGRLSSVNPNVQNIPIRTEEGNKIRAAFVADEGYRLISADYSQIELRILSHVADIKSLKLAFEQGRDIHAHTASQIFGIPTEQITSEARRKAKAINFGIIYGISSFGLARQLSIPRAEASDYIKKYFTEYPGIREYMSNTIEFTRKHGFVYNLIGRKCYMPAINSKDHNLRSFAERAAINAPMQSLASDIVKMAMINIQKSLSGRSLKTKMLMQIHDELIFEAPENEEVSVQQEIKSVMEGISIPGIKLDVQIKAGKNWQEIH